MTLEELELSSEEKRRRQHRALYEVPRTFISQD
jgi:hypothetical protein